MLARAVRSFLQWFIPREILRKIFAIAAVDIRPTVNGARGTGIKAMAVSLCSIRKNQTLLL